MSTTLNDTLDTAKGMMDSAKDGTQHAVSSARSTMFDGIRAVSGFINSIRGLEVNDALGWVGLARRSSPIGSIALFGAGVAVGAGVGMLFAPMAGTDARRAILQRFWGLEKKAEAGVKDIEQKVEKKVETFADKAKDKVENLTDKAKDKVETFTDKAKDKVENLTDKAKDVAASAQNKVAEGVETAKDAVKSATDDIKPTYGSMDSYERRDNGKTAKPNVNGDIHRAR